jgi:phage baseplate assembly protein W
VKGGLVHTFALVHGDLVINTDGGYTLYNGAARIKQDLTLALTEEYGFDRFHPKYGSIIRNYLGQIISPEMQALVQAEVNRVLQNYIIIQQNSVLRDTVVDVQGVFDTSDVVRSVDDITVRTLLDTIYLSATLTTLARESITITRQVSA